VASRNRELSRAELRAKKRRTKTFVARLEFGMIIFTLTLVIGGGVVAYNQIPGVKANRLLILMLTLLNWIPAR